MKKDSIKAMLGRALVQLLKVKTLITLMVVGALTAAFLMGTVSVEVYAPLATAVVTYCFRKGDKKDD